MSVLPSTRQLRLEALEPRQLLAAELFFPIESGGRLEGGPGGERNDHRLDRDRSSSDRTAEVRHLPKPNVARQENAERHGPERNPGTANRHPNDRLLLPRSTQSSPASGSPRSGGPDRRGAEPRVPSGGLETGLDRVSRLSPPPVSSISPPPVDRAPPNPDLPNPINQIRLPNEGSRAPLFSAPVISTENRIATALRPTGPPQATNALPVNETLVSVARSQNLVSPGSTTNSGASAVASQSADSPSGDSVLRSSRSGLTTSTPQPVEFGTTEQRLAPDSMDTMAKAEAADIIPDSQIISDGQSISNGLIIPLEINDLTLPHPSDANDDPDWEVESSTLRDLRQLAHPSPEEASIASDAVVTGWLQGPGGLIDIESDDTAQRIPFVPLGNIDIVIEASFGLEHAADFMDWSVLSSQNRKQQANHEIRDAILAAIAAESSKEDGPAPSTVSSHHQLSAILYPVAAITLTTLAVGKRHRQSLLETTRPHPQP